MMSMKPKESDAITRLSRILSPRFCLYAACAFFSLMVLAGAIPGKAEALSAAVYDKLLHFSAYAFLSALIYGACCTNSIRPAMRAVRTLLLIAILSTVDEGIQALMPYRDANLLDWIVNVLAALATILALGAARAAWEAALANRPGPST